MVRSNISFMKKSILLLFYLLLCVLSLSKVQLLYSLLPKRLAIIGTGIAVAGFIALAIFYRQILTLIFHRLTIFREIKIGVLSFFLIFFLSVSLKILAINIFHIDSLLHPDIHVYAVTADEMNRLGKVVTYGKYCMDYPHMFWFAFTLRPVVALFGINSDALSYYMVLISSLSLLLIFDILRRTISLKCGLIFCAFFSLLPSQILLPGYIVHEQMLTLLLCLALWFLIGIPKSNNHTSAVVVKNNALFFCGALMIAFSIQVNAAGLVAAIAFCIVILDGKVSDDLTYNWIRKSMKILVIILLIFLVGKGCAIYQNQKTVLPSDYKKTNRIVWTLYVGSNMDSKGQWNEKDTITFLGEEEQTEEELNLYRKKLLMERYTSLIEHPSNLVKLVTKKYSETWTGFFYPLSYANELIQDPSLQEFYHSYLFKPLSLVDFGLGFLLVIFCLVSSLYRIRQMPDSLFFSSLYILGVTAMLLLTECTQKYTISVQPFIAMVCITLIEMSEIGKGSA